MVAALLSVVVVVAALAPFDLPWRTGGLGEGRMERGEKGREGAMGEVCVRPWGGWVGGEREGGERKGRRGGMLYFSAVSFFFDFPVFCVIHTFF